MTKAYVVVIKSFNWSANVTPINLFRNQKTVSHSKVSSHIATFLWWSVIIGALRDTEYKVHLHEVGRKEINIQTMEWKRMSFLFSIILFAHLFSVSLQKSNKFFQNKFSWEVQDLWDERILVHKIAVLLILNCLRINIFLKRELQS